MVTIVESGLQFGDFSEHDIYQIEHSAGHSSLGSGFKMVEFTYLNNQSLFIVEAKSSIPNPKNKEDYDKFWDEIFEKFENALLLQLMGCLKRNEAVTSELPLNHKKIEWDKTLIKLRLVIPTVPTEYLPPMTDSFRKKIYKIKTLWQIKNEDIFVINEDKANKERLIIK